MANQGTATEEQQVEAVPLSLVRAMREAREPMEALRRALSDPRTPVPVLASAARAACEAVSQLSTLASAAEASRGRC